MKCRLMAWDWFPIFGMDSPLRLSEESSIGHLRSVAPILRATATASTRATSPETHPAGTPPDTDHGALVRAAPFERSRWFVVHGRDWVNPQIATLPSAFARRLGGDVDEADGNHIVSCIGRAWERAEARCEGDGPGSLARELQRRRDRFGSVVADESDDMEDIPVELGPDHAADRTGIAAARLHAPHTDHLIASRGTRPMQRVSGRRKQAQVSLKVHT
jgi:hypothetical protein